MAKFPFYNQLDAMDCGPSCLQMISKYYGKTYSIQTLRDKCFITREGVSLLGISDAAESIGLRSKGVRINFEQLKADVTFPSIIHWNQNHFIIVYRITKNKVYVADPAHGLLKYSHEEFVKSWIQDGSEKGLCLLIEKAPDFHLVDDEIIDKSGFKFLFSYVKPYKKYLFQLITGLLIGSLVLLLFPFLTQQIVDYGINNHNIGFIYLVLIAQLILFLGRTSVDFIRGWILLHISTRVNISLISDFLIKLMKLPIGFFDIKKIGDLLQRISDHTRIESFITNSTLSILFSFVNLIVFGIVLGFYSLKILAVFIIGSFLYVLWVYLFMKKRRVLDYKRFNQLADNQSNLIQLITGMQEIKLNNCEKQKRWEWENIQAKLFRVNVKGLSLSQNQRAGATILNESKNIFITFIAATAVIGGSMSLGMMLAVVFMIGQLNSPLEQLILFLNKAQDAKISLERLAEIHKKDDEESKVNEKISFIPEDKSIYINNLSFQYEGPQSEMVLNDINISIPEKKVTAIVGTSGSGKTTLLKLLLGFYAPTRGEIKVGDINQQSLNEKVWRNKCGAVMQDGFIFSDTIARNVAISDERIDQKRFYSAIKVANIQQFVQNLPLGYNTKIGADGHGLSQGQKQRILIARAVYKNPDFLFFDEATNSLDANNEKIIMNNLDEFFKGKTVMVIAHRLSTVKNADQIIVIEKGKVIEIGSHSELAERRSSYYNLVKNQLELGV
ncbi:MAG: peptidase domain-containing ABC transporter [Cytophagia bacterium]|nr:peptidase domain-containing ABC transporter [Cytophagia bacterium]MBT7993237.1 peptidase domain-containing ABC transporter [Bacteroidota bacterium]